MKPKTLKAAFKDRRGAITDILDGVPLNAVTLITSRKGVARGNHFHKKTVQHLYLLSGRLRYVCRVKGGRTRAYVMNPGDFMTSPPHEAHTVVALKDSAFLALSRGPRHGRNYEADTYRLSDPIA